MPRLPGQDGIENISGIAWDDIDKVNAIQKANIENISGVIGGDEFIWGQQTGVYLFTSFQKAPTSGTDDENKEYPPYNDDGDDYAENTPSYGNYPADDQEAEVGNTLYNLGKRNSNDTTGWLNGEDQFWRPEPPTGEASSITVLNHHNGSFTNQP